MYLASGFVINNLGDYYGCNKIDSAKYTVIKMNAKPVTLYTLCGPEVCTKEDYYNLKMTFFGIDIENAIDIIFSHEYQQDHFESYTNGAICMLIVIGILIIICIIGTILEYFANENTKSSNFGKFLLCFSFLANGKMLLLRKNQEKKLDKSDNLEILTGIRVLSVGWIIVLHVYKYYLLIPALSNELSANDFVSDIHHLIAYVGAYATDTFLWLSAFLFAYFLLAQLDNDPSFTFKELLMLYIHR